MLRRLFPLLSALIAFAAAPPVAAQSTFDRVKSSGVVRVCIWPDYYGITFRSPRTEQLSGLDIDLSALLGRQLGLKVTYVDSSFASLVGDLTGDRCDVAMFAIAMLPQRMERLRFTRPYLSSGIYAVTTKSNPVVKAWADIDRPGVLVAVQAGTFMEPVMASELKKAQLVKVAAPATRELELEAGRVDVFMTDYPYSRRLLDNADWARLIAPPKPFHVLPYAYAVKPGDEAWFTLMDGFVGRIQRDGSLAEAARKHGLADIVAP
ncbi:ABC transporter substrate-binding protein [Pseudorhodoferax sp. Leaf267]|uniref:ABC transporter substrate-binding protein n=1 Tax=Pseudorhodoferax sp. Leaf267 TaxID=1736316 RepID=UPI000A6C6086|nr:ABC transporter substrate-binding protein [Pseudorhodoferax sp. Leaf267]